MRGVWIALFGLVLGVATIVSPVAGFSSAHGPELSGHALFTMTNSASGNQIMEFAQAPSGTLVWVANVSAGGTGTGTSLADSGSLTVTADHRWLLAVDAGSNQVSVFHIGRGGGVPSLRLTDVAPSGGATPVSVTTFGRLVYVLNVGNATLPGNIAGFYLTASGQLNSIPGAVEPLSFSGATGAAQISFNPSGTILVVTEKATNLIDVFSLGRFGVAGPAVFEPSQGETPYGFAFAPDGALIVSEAATGSLSSYQAGPYGQWQVLSSAVPDFQTAPCWVAVGANGNVAYTTNAGSDSISSYAVAHSGVISLQSEVAATTDAAPTDLAVSVNGQFLYVHDAGALEIQGFAVSSTGGLTWVSTIGGLASGGEGLVAI